MSVATIQAQLNTLTPKLVEDPSLQPQVDQLIIDLQAAEQEEAAASATANQQVVAGQQQMVVDANTNPGAVVAQTPVAAATVTPGQLIDSAIGQAAPVAPVAPATVAPVDIKSAEVPEPLVTNTMEAALASAEAEGIIDQTEAATAAPSANATVQGQLTKLMQDFEGGETPVWASGAMRQAMGVMQSRGMGASSIAGAAVVQAAMESAIGIASQDANTNLQFEMQNLNNEQQTTIFKTQQRLSSLFTDQSATNASAQFNATSKNQTDQFFSNLQATASQFNAAQVNAIRQFNAGETNTIEKFNSTITAQRDQFNAQNSLVISQSNAQWRQSVATASTAAQNISNLEYTKQTNAVTGAALDQIWQRERDLMDFAFTSSESSLDRASAIMLAKLSDTAQTDALKLQEKMAGDRATSAFLGNIATSLLFGN
jgi:hypothetical protein